MKILKISCKNVRHFRFSLTPTPTPKELLHVALGFDLLLNTAENKQIPSIAPLKPVDCLNILLPFHRAPPHRTPTLG